MPNATVRANARTLPEVTSRRSILGAVLATGAAGAAAILPASASGAPQLSAVDRRVLQLWRRRRAAKGICDRLSADWNAKHDLLPSWADSGAVYLRPDGSPTANEAQVGWPLVADLSRRPVVNGVINARRSAEDLYHEFKAARAVAGSWVEPTHEFARALVELSDRLLQQRAEEDRVGLIPDYDDRLERAYDVLHAIEDKISDLVPVSILALGADLIPRIERDDDEEADMRAWRATLTAVRFQLIDIIAEDADQVLAQKTEVART
jgi:hypothetical protein